MKFFKSNGHTKLMKTPAHPYRPVPSRLLKQMRTVVLPAMAAAMVLLPDPSIQAASATPPDRMSYQGFLVNETGTPLANAAPANFTVVFKIYNASENGDLIWSEQQVVTVDKGNFSVVLGEGSIFNSEPRPALSTVFAGSTGGDRYLSTTVTISGNPVTLLPRLRLLPNAYAFLASQANQLVSPSTGAPFLTYNSVANTMTVVGAVNATAGFTGLTPSQVPSIDASKITTGSFDAARIPSALTGPRTFSGNVGFGTLFTGYPITMGNGLGNTKFALWDNGSGLACGMGIQSGQYRFHVSGSGTERFSFLNAPAGTEVFTIKGDGKVGVNQSNPGVAMDVNGDVRANNMFWSSGGALVDNQGGSLELGNSLVANLVPFIDFHYGVGVNQDFNVRLINGANGRLDLLGGNMYFQNRVGIGTLSPRGPLDIVSYNSIGNVNFTYYARGASGANTGNSGGNPGNYSIVADGRIWALEFNSYSDARTKSVIGPSDRKKDLELIDQLVVKDYTQVDQVEHGNARKKGFIAQEVQKLIPEAVTTSKQFVPDIFVLPDSFKFDGAKNEMLLNLPKQHGLKKGDTVKLFVDKARLELPVIEVPSSTNFVVGRISTKPANVFVHGHEVSDFMTLNYDRIFVTGISAIQELHRITQADQARISALESEVAALKKQLAAQTEASSALEARFSALEKSLKTALIPVDDKSIKTAGVSQ